MINVSNAFREQLNNDNRNYLCYVKITLHDETVLNVENDKLWSSGVEIERAVSSDNTFDIGSVIINKATIVLNNIYDDFTEYDFSDATVYIEIGLELENETIERVKLGTFYVDEPKYNGSLISLECLDSMSRFDVDYSESNLTYPATLLEIVRDACSACGVTSGIATLPNGDYTVEEKPDVESLTFRQVLQWAAQICCQWFTIDENDRLVSGWYVVPDEDSGYHTLSGVNSITVDTDDVVITGVKVTEFVEDTDKDPAVYQSGNDGYVLGISENKLITTGKGSAVAVYLGQQLIGMRFRPFSATCQNDPTIEAGDPVSISDYKGNVFHSFVTNFKFTTWNSENFSCGAESAKRKSASRYSQLTQAYVQNRKNMRKQKTEFEKQMEELANRINTSSGLYMTEEVQEDGSTIYYLHNKPTLEESMIIWEMTAEAFAVSNDGGKSWSAGLTVDGELIARIMNTIGINFDWGVGGSLVITDEEGNETFYANAETGEVRIVATSFILNGKTVQQITQEVAGEVAKEEAENTIGDFVQGEYKDTIQDIYNSLDQKSETWYQATDPALEWTEVESTPLQDTAGSNIFDTAGETIITIWEKEKSLHNGDLWKNSTTNKEYLYQNGEWVEMPIPDEVFDMIDGKAQIFVVQPTPPYDVGDVWFTGTTILVCNTKRENGSFSESDWGKKDNYTDDSALYEFIEGDYSETVENLKNQADKKAETWYQSTDPSTGWTAAEKQIHTGDLWYNTSDEKTYIYNGSAWELTKTTPPDEVFDAIDGKAQIFVSQPKPPYSVGDLWFNSATSDIMTCIKARSSGNYVASDWQKRNKYTDDSYAQEVNQELNQFITDYQDEIKEIQNQVDQKAETWYQTSDPALQWTDKENIPLADTTGASILDTTGATITTIRESEKMLHDGDLWHNPSNNNEYIYQDGEWHKTSVPDDVFDIIDGKAQIFVAQPYPPYSVGDLWFNSATSDIMTCINGRESGSYTSSDWQKRNKYTDDSYAEEVAGDLSNFADQVVGDLENLQTQIDGKIETYYYDYQPTLTNIPASAWTTEEERQKHIGDLFYYKSTGFTYRFLKDGNVWKWQAIKDEDISKALSDAADAQDTADSKRRVFTSTPTPPYDVGDLWAQGSNGDIMRCKTARSSGAYVSTDWEKASKYTDDTAVDDLDEKLNSTEEIFNRLTQDGKVKGIYLKNGQLYINASYLASGAINIRDSDGNETLYANVDTGVVRIKATSFSLTDGRSIEDIASDEINDFVTSIYTPKINSLQSQIDGQIETYYYDYQPTLTNTPASAWTTETERQSHEGDIFYWKSKGYAYRFYKDGSTWKWQLVQDTDITKALQQAADAQDTADQKRRVFVRQPTPPYDVGDLWVGNDTSDLMRCQRSRSSGNYDASDWIKAVKYTDDTELYNFVQNDYNTTIQEIYQSVDQKAETWYQSTDPSLQWTDTESDPLQDTTGASIFDTTGATIVTIYESEKALHDGDLWHDTTNNKEYIYVDGEWQETSIPDDVLDIIDGKAQIFVSTPTPPYAIGDLWFNSATSDIMTCINGRESGSYTSSDWQKRNKYTDDSALNEFLSGEYQETIQELKDQADRKSETWYQSNDPAASWSAEEKENHAGDLWYNTGNQNTYIYNGASWQLTKTTPPDDVFDQIDGKAQIFVNQPVPPYAVGDLWFNSVTSDIMTCIRGRSSGSYSSGDWQKRNKYTDDSYAQDVAKELLDFSDAVTGDISNLQTQIDGKIETWYYNYQPTLSNIPASQWTTTSERQKHVGDLFYWQSQGYTYRFQQSGSSFAWQKIQDSDISDAMEEASKAQDTADSKRRVFVTTPVPPYDVGDLWCGNSSSDLKRCQKARASGSYVASDWIKAVKYTDDSAVDDLDQSLTQQDIFNRLTNNGQTQGIYLRNGRLYINASYIGSGTLSANYIKGGTLTLGGANNVDGSLMIYDASGKVLAKMNGEGVNLYNSNFYSSYISGAELTGVSIKTTGISITPDVVDNQEYYQIVSALAGKLNLGNSNFNTDINAKDTVTIWKDLTVWGDFIVFGEKNRFVKTVDYGDRLQYSYEMSSPMFVDTGEAQTDENGECYIFLDDIFKETVTTSIEYQVFLQKEGDGDIWVAGKNEEYFTVKGTPNLKFAWEIKAKQRDYELKRLEEHMGKDSPYEPDYEIVAESEIEKMWNIDYESEASQMVDAYYKGLEGAFI